MKKSGRTGWSHAAWSSLTSVFQRGRKHASKTVSSRANQLAAIAGSASSLEQLEQRQLLFSLTITPDLVNPATGLGTIINQFIYAIPTLNPDPGMPSANDVVLEDFDDEMDAWTQVVPPAVPNFTTFSGSSIVASFSGPTPQPLVLQRIGGTTVDQRIIANLSTTDQATFQFQTAGQGNTAATPRKAIAMNLTIFNGTDGGGLNTTPTGTKLELLADGVVVQTLSGSALAALGLPVGGGGTRYDINFVAGFDSFRFSSATPGNPTYADSFVIGLINTTFPSTQFAQGVEERLFGAIFNFTAPVGATIRFFDVYGDDMRLTLIGKTPNGGQLPLIDANGDGIPDYNDGIGRIEITGTNQLSSFTIIGGTVEENMPPNDPTDFIGTNGDAAWKVVLPDSPNGLFDMFEQAGFGFAFTPMGDAVEGLPDGPGSVIIGSPYVRDRTSTQTYFGFTPRTFNVEAQGVFVTGAIGSVRLDGPAFGVSRFSGAIERYTPAAQYGSLRFEGDVGTLVISGDAGVFFLDSNTQISPDQGNPIVTTNSRVFIGRTVRQILVSGRNSMDIEVLGDINNPNRPVLNQRDFFSNEFILGIDPGIDNGIKIVMRNALINGTDWSGRFGGRGQPILYGNTYLRNDARNTAEFVGYNGTSVRIFGDAGASDPVNTGIDATDVYSFPADPSREVIISGLNGVFGARRVRVEDHNGNIIVDTDGGGAGRGSNGERGGQRILRFRPDYANTYFLVVDNAANGLIARTTFGIQIDGMSPVTLGSLRVASGAGALAQNSFILAGNSVGNGGFTLNVASGSLGQLSVGNGYTDNTGALTEAVINTNQIAKVVDSLGGSAINVAGNLYQVYVGSDIRGAQIATGGDIGTITTGRNLSIGTAPLFGDLYAADIRAGGRIALLDIAGGVGIDQRNPSPPTFDNRNGPVSIQTGRSVNRRGDIGQFLVGAYVDGSTLSVITTPGSVWDQFRVGTVNGGAGTDFPGEIIGSQPLIRMGAGSDLRFVDFSNIRRPGDNGVSTTVNYGQTARFTDDAGAVYTFTISGGNVPTDGTPGAFLNSSLVIRVLPIDGSQGVAIARINANLLGGANLVINGETQGVASIGHIIINSPPDTTGTQPATPIINSSLTATGTSQIDIGRISQPVGAMNAITNQTIGGDIVMIDALALNTLTINSGSLGRTQVLPGWSSPLLGVQLGLVGMNPQMVGQEITISTDVISTELPWSGDFGTLLINGSPVDDRLDGLLVRTGDVQNVRVAGAIGDVIVTGGDLIALEANTDGVRAQGAFDGIVGNIYAVNIGTIEMGDGLRGTGGGPLAQASIAAEGRIFQVLSTQRAGAVVNGLIIAAGARGAATTVGTGTTRDYGILLTGIGEVRVNNGRFDGAYIAVEELEDWWNSTTANDQAIIRGSVNFVGGNNSDFFRSFVQGIGLGQVTLTGTGAWDASATNLTAGIGTITANEFRNTTRLGNLNEYLPSIIRTSTDVATISTTGNLLDIADLNLDIGGSITGGVSARNILRSTFEVNNVINSIRAINDIRGVLVNAGTLIDLIAQNGNIRTTTLTLAGPIQRVTADNGEITQLDIDSRGPDGRLDLLTASGRIQGRILSSGGIGRIESVNSDVQADITTRLEPTRVGLPGLQTLRAGRDYIGSMTILGNVGTIFVKRNIGVQTQTNAELDFRSNVDTIDIGSGSESGQLYSDLLVGQSITGAVRINRVEMRAGRDKVGTSDIVAFGSINLIDIKGDFGGNIISRSGGITTINITDGSFRKGKQIIVDDGSLGTLNIKGGDLLGDVLVSGDITAINITNGDDGFKGQIGVTSFRRSNRQWKNDIRNELPPGVDRSSAVDGVLIKAGGSIGRVFVQQGSVWESRIIAGRNIDTVDIGLQLRNDALTTGMNNQIVAGDRIGTVTTRAFNGGVGIVAGVRSLGADNSLGGTGANADVVQTGQIGTLTFSGRKIVNSVIAAGIQPNSSGQYNTAGARSVGGSSTIGNVFANNVINVSAFSDGTLGTTSAGIVRGGPGLAPNISEIINTPLGGEVPVSAGSAYSFTTTNGQTGTALFSGPGQVFWHAPTNTLRLVNTTSATTLTIARPSNGDLSSLRVRGNSNAALGTLVVNARILGNASLYLDAAIGSATFNAPVITTGIIGSGGNINTLTFNGGFLRGQILANRLTSLAVNGNYGRTDIPTGASLIAAQVSTINITGLFTGSISSDMTIASFTAGAMNRGGLRSGDAITSVTLSTRRDPATDTPYGMYQSRISARNLIGTVTVNGATIDGTAFRGDVVESAILAGADLGTDADFGGTGTAADTVTNGVITTVNINGDFRKSDIGAGVLRGVSGFLGNADTIAAAGRSRINSVVIGGNTVGSLSNSEQYRIQSTGTVGTVTVNGAGFQARNNFRVQAVEAVAIPVRVLDLRVLEDSRLYTAFITFNQQVDQSTLASALSVTELRAGGSVTVPLTLGTDYTITYDSTKMEARVQFSRTITARNLPQVAGVAGPGVYQFRLSGSLLRGSTQSTLLDGNADGAPGDDWARNAVVGDAGDKITAGNPAGSPTIDFFGAADLDLVLRSNVALGSLPQVNQSFTIRGVMGDHPDVNPDTFRAGGDADVYRISLRAGQILRLGDIQGVAQQTSRGIFNSAGQRIDLATNLGVRALPANINTAIISTPESQFLVTQTGTYFIVLAAALGQIDIANVNDVANVDPVAGSFGGYSFSVMVFDDQNSGFLGDSASGTGAGVAYAPTPSAFAGPDTVLGTSDDLTQFNVGDWVFRRTTENGSPIVSGINSQGWTSIRRAGPNGTFGDADDQVAINIDSSIGLPGSFGQPNEVASDVDVFRLNNGQPIAPGTKIRATLRLTERGSVIGLSPEQAGREVDLTALLGQDLIQSTKFAIFETPAGTSFENARLVAAPSDFLPIGGQAQSLTTDGRSSYGYDAKGDFFIEFIVPGAQGITGAVPSSYALYLQGSIRSDYTLEVVQQGTGSVNPAKQNILLETLGGTIGWLQAGAGVTTAIDPFDVASLGLTGQVGGMDAQTYVLSNLVARLNAIFTAANINIVISTTADTFQRQDFSTVFLAGNSEPNAFFNNGTFGASQHVDAFNADKNDDAVVFLPSLGALGYDASQTGVDNLVSSLTAAVGRRIGELIGLNLETSSFGSSTNPPIMAADSVSTLPGVGGEYTFPATDRFLAQAQDTTLTSLWFMGAQNAQGLIRKLVAPRV